MKSDYLWAKSVKVYCVKRITVSNCEGKIAKVVKLIYTWTIDRYRLPTKRWHWYWLFFWRRMGEERRWNGMLVAIIYNEIKIQKDLARLSSVFHLLEFFSVVLFCQIRTDIGILFWSWTNESRLDVWFMSLFFAFVFSFSIELVESGYVCVFLSMIWHFSFLLSTKKTKVMFKQYNFHAWNCFFFSSLNTSNHCLCRILVNKMCCATNS